MPVDALTRRYAAALYAEAAAGGGEAAVFNSLEVIAGAMEAEPELATLLKHPGIPDATKAEVLVRLSGTEDKLYKRFVELVISRGRPQVLAGCAEAFRQLWDRDRGVTRARVASALPLTSEQAERLAEALCRLTAGEVHIDATTEPDLVGGVTVRMGDTLLDGSLRTRLKKVAETLRAH
jgi:F-type H+-transporting ATPase subunit delta